MMQVEAHLLEEISTILLEHDRAGDWREEHRHNAANAFGGVEHGIHDVREILVGHAEQNEGVYFHIVQLEVGFMTNLHCLLEEFGIRMAAVPRLGYFPRHIFEW